MKNGLFAILAILLSVTSCLIGYYVDCFTTLELPTPVWFFWGAMTVVVPLLVGKGIK